jgi:hypothetical protein
MERSSARDRRGLDKALAEGPMGVGQRGGHGRAADAQHPGDLGFGQVGHVPEDDDLALAPGKIGA